MKEGIKIKSFARLFLGSVIALVLLSCSAKAQEASAGDPVARAFAEAGLPLLSRKVSPRDFSLPTLAGETQSLAALKGKVVFLNFWATWCGPCRDEMPSMEALYMRFREKGLEIIAVNSGERQPDVLAFMQSNRLSFPALLDEDGRVSGDYGIRAIPTSFLIDREGMIILRKVGSIDWDTPAIHAAMEALLD